MQPHLTVLCWSEIIYFSNRIVLYYLKFAYKCCIRLSGLWEIHLKQHFWNCPVWCFKNHSRSLYSACLHYWKIWVLNTPHIRLAVSGCGRAGHNLYCDLSQALALQVRDRLGSMETEHFGSEWPIQWISFPLTVTGTKHSVIRAWCLVVSKSRRDQM